MVIFQPAMLVFRGVFKKSLVFIGNPIGDLDLFLKAEFKDALATTETDWVELCR